MVKIFTALFMASQSPIWIPYGIFRRNICCSGIKKEEKSEILFKLDNIKTSS